MDFSGWLGGVPFDGHWYTSLDADTITPLGCAAFLIARGRDAAENCTDYPIPLAAKRAWGLQGRHDEWNEWIMPLP